MTTNEYVKPGDPITARRWNNLVDVAYGRVGPARRAKRSYFTGINTDTTTMPAGSVAVLDAAGPDSSAHLHVNLKKGGTGLVVANDGYGIPADEAGPVRIIDDWAPTQVNSTGTINYGDKCGPAAGAWEVSTNGSGLIAVSPALNGKVWVVSEGGGANASVAVTTEVIPARSVDVPGGPVTVTKRTFNEGTGLLEDGETVPVYSWVKTDSADPTNEPDGRLYIWIEEDEGGVWWFTGQDCTKPPVSILEGSLSTDTVVTTTVQGLPGTELTMPTFEGPYLYEVSAEISVVGVPGNQTWDLDLGLYNVTDDQWIKVWDWTGAGNPLTNPVFNAVYPFNLGTAFAGKEVVLGVVRSTTTGTVTILALDGQGNAATAHSITGPL